MIKDEELADLVQGSSLPDPVIQREKEGASGEIVATVKAEPVVECLLSPPPRRLSKGKGQAIIPIPAAQVEGALAMTNDSDDEPLFVTPASAPAAPAVVASTSDVSSHSASPCTQLGPDPPSRQRAPPHLARPSRRNWPVSGPFSHAPPPATAAPSRPSSRPTSPDPNLLDATTRKYPIPDAIISANRPDGPPLTTSPPRPPPVVVASPPPLPHPHAPSQHFAERPAYVPYARLPPSPSSSSFSAADSLALDSRSPSQLDEFSFLGAADHTVAPTDRPAPSPFASYHPLPFTLASAPTHSSSWTLAQPNQLPPPHPQVVANTPGPLLFSCLLTNSDPRNPQAQSAHLLKPLHHPPSTLGPPPPSAPQIASASRSPSACTRRKATSLCRTERTTSSSAGRMAEVHQSSVSRPTPEARRCCCRSRSLGSPSFGCE